MIDTAGYLTCAVAVLGALCRLWPGRGTRPRTGDGRVLPVGFALCMGLSALLLAPASTAAAEHWRPLWRVLPLLGTESRLAAEYLLARMAHTVRGAASSSTRIRRQTGWSALVMLCAAALYLAAGTVPDGGELVAGPGGRPALVAYDVLFTAHSAWCVGLFTVVMHRSVRHVGPGLLRVGLRLVAAGGAAGLVWTALSLVPLVAGIAIGRQDSAEDVCSAPVAVLCLSLGIGGATLTVWGRNAAAPVRRLRALRAYHRLGPLWSALHAVRPEIALEPAAAWWRRGGAARDSEFALYRRVIEIRDGQLALRDHVHPRAVEWAGGDGGCAPAAGRGAAVAEAAAVASALEAAAAGRRFPPGGYRAPEVGADLDAEAAWLVRVCEAFTGAAEVAEVRRRVRRELGT